MQSKRIIAACSVGAIGCLLGVSAINNPSTSDFIKEKEALASTNYAGVTNLLYEYEGQEIFINEAEIKKVALENYYYEKEQERLEQERIVIQSEYKTVSIPTNSIYHTVIPNELPSGEIEEVEVDIPINYHGFKTFMDYRKITDVFSRQYMLEQLENCYTDENGFRRIKCKNPTDSNYTDRYVIALGTGTSVQIGDVVNLNFEDGTTIPCVVGDYKSDAHTDNTNKITSVNPNNPCASEFIVEEDKLPALVKFSGNCSYYFNNVNKRLVSVDVFNENLLG